MKSTIVIRFPLETVSCKQRSGPPGDDLADLDNEEWYSCVIPLQTVSLPCIPDPTVPAKALVPIYANHFIGPSIVPLGDAARATLGLGKAWGALSGLGLGLVCGLAIGWWAGVRRMR